MKVTLTLAAAVAAAVVAGTAVPASASVPIRTFRNCTAMHKVYPHGVGKRGAHDHTSGRPVTNFFRNNRLYAANTSLDRDRDGIACEKA
jgi:hypothetical protein